MKKIFFSIDFFYIIDKKVFILYQDFLNLMKGGKMKTLVVNPGSTSTKIGVFEDRKELFTINIKHQQEKLKNCKDIFDELPYRKEEILKVLKENNYRLGDFDAFSGRGGPMKPLKAGIYKVDQAMVDDIYNGNYQTMHASLLGALIVHEFAKEINKPAFIVDPISTDEMLPIAKITGHPEIKMQALTHALNVRASARKASEILGKKLKETKFIIVHLGGGISVNAIVGGKIIDVLESRQTGPFSPTSCGDLPIKQFIKWIKKNNVNLDTIPNLFNKEGGLTLYFGTDNVKELLERSKNDRNIEEILKAMCLRIAKSILSLFATMRMEVEKVIFTGGIAHSKTIIDWITYWFNGKIDYMVIPGENEMKALAEGAYRALNQEEEILDYSMF